MTHPTLRLLDLARDGEIATRFAREVFVTSFGDDARFVRQFGEDGGGYAGWLRERLAEDPAAAAMAVWEGEAVGLVVTGRAPADPAIGYVYHYYLSPAARGRGWGAVLDDYAMTVLARRGHRRARLSVVETNGPAMRFYAKHGWAPAGPRPDQPGVIFMEKAVGAA